MFSAKHLAAALSALPQAECYWVGYSGGADSTALLTALVESKVTLNIKALHVNHGLHPDCDTWQNHCAQYCQDLGVHFETRRISPVPHSGDGLEAEARRLRYNIAASLLGKNEVFLTAHHLDDQAETLLLNLVRGSGVDGLAGMPKSRILGQGLLARPLLGVHMESLKQYLNDRDISWIEDPSNKNLDYERNFLRHQMIPLMENRWPGVKEQLVNSAVLCREASTVLGRWAQVKLEHCLLHPQVLNLASLPAPNDEFRMLLRQWLRFNNVPPIPGKRLIELCEQIAQATSKSRLCIEWQNWAIRYYQQSLWLEKATQLTASWEISWSEPECLELGAGFGFIEFKGSDRLPKQKLSIRGRSGGDSLLMRGLCRRKVKDLLRESGFPPWLRPSVPLITGGDEVLAIGDLFIGAHLLDWQDAQLTELIWHPEHSLLRFCRDRFKARAVDPETALR